MKLLLVTCCLLIQSFHINGRHLDCDETPVALLKMNSVTNASWVCSGVFIHPSFVLTAAQCLTVYGTSNTAMTGAEVKVYATIKSVLQQKALDVSKVVVHPGYNELLDYNRMNNLALVKLTTPVNVKEVALATLPKAPVTEDELELFFVGWDEKLNLQYRVTETESCSEKCVGTKKWEEAKTYTATVCLKQYYEEICDGFEGAPVFYPCDTETVYGIALGSGYIMCYNETTNYMVNLYYFSEWLDTTMKTELSSGSTVTEQTTAATEPTLGSDSMGAAYLVRQTEVNLPAECKKRSNY